MKLTVIRSEGHLVHMHQTDQANRTTDHICICIPLNYFLTGKNVYMTFFLLWNSEDIIKKQRFFLLMYCDQSKNK